MSGEGRRGRGNAGKGRADQRWRRGEEDGRREEFVEGFGRGRNLWKEFRAMGRMRKGGRAGDGEEMKGMAVRQFGGGGGGSSGRLRTAAS